MDEEQRERLTIIVLGEATTSARNARRAAPVLIVLAILFYVAAFSLGVRYGWRMDAWTTGTRSGPLWFMIPAIFATATAIMVFAITYLRAKTRELREAIARVDNDHS